MTHELKCWPEFFAATANGMKTAELRREDRGFAPWDTLRLREWDPATGEYTGRELEATVTHVLRGDGSFGLAAGWAMLSILVGRR